MTENENSDLSNKADTVIGVLFCSGIGETQRSLLERSARLGFEFHSNNFFFFKSCDKRGKPYLDLKQYNFLHPLL